MGPLGHLQVDLGRLLVCLPGFGHIAPHVGVSYLIEPLSQSHQEDVRLTRQQVLEKSDGPGPRDGTAEVRHGGAHVLGDLAIRGLQITPAGIQNAGDRESQGVC
jgi:hypothetical protein